MSTGSTNHRGGSNIHQKQQTKTLKFTNDSVTELLTFINQKSMANLKEMAEFLKNKHDIQVTTQAISNFLKEIDITWKQVTNIPASWNQPDLLE